MVEAMKEEGENYGLACNFKYPVTKRQAQSCMYIFHYILYYQLTLDLIKGISRGLETLQRHTNDSYYTSMLCWPEPTINPSTSRVIGMR